MFVNLYKYRPRIRQEGSNDRTPEEDWLTECLAACLRALWNADPMLVSPVLAELFEISAVELAEILEGKAFRIETQISTSDGTRPDMVFYSGEHVFLVVENKVSHTAHVEQLAGYADWLRAKCSAHGPKGIGFITHYTRPPEKFRADAKEFQGLSVQSTTWAAIGKKLLNQTETLGKDSHAKELAQSFFEMLKELDMATQYPTNKAFASGELYLSEGSGLSILIQELRTETEILGDFSGQRWNETKPNFDFGYFAANRWCNDLFCDKGGTVYTGIWYPEIGTLKAALTESRQTNGINWNENNSAKIFLNLANTEGIPSKFQPEAERWIAHDDKELIIFRDISSFSGDADARAVAMKGWVRKMCQEFLDHRYAIDAE